MPLRLCAAVLYWQIFVHGASLNNNRGALVGDAVFITTCSAIVHDPSHDRWGIPYKTLSCLPIVPKQK